MAESICAGCGAANRDGAKFCAECGASLAASCPACGTPAGGGRFCSECGAPLSAAAGSSATAAAAGATTTGPPAAPVAERRVVSLLFGDLVGFTPISEARDPEAVRELLSAYFDRARAVVERYGGVVEKFIGDAVFAVWGVPAAHEDDAERAVRAGLDLTSAVTALGEELGVDGLQMRVGITTGQVAVTLGAVGEGMVAGDAVNTAARVQSVAAPGQVWVDDPTRSLTTASLAYAPMGPHELKGKATPVSLFHAVRTTAVVGGEQRVDGLEAPFVGRDRDLRLVKELFHATAEERRPRLVLVAGEPGIGKSRLAWEFEKYVDAIAAQATYWLRGRCLSYGHGVAGRVVAEMIRSLLRVTDADSDEVVRLALEERLQRHVATDSDRDVLRPRLESLLGLTDRTFDQADLFACWRAFLESLPDETSSVTLVVEDLQWADDGFLDFLDHLLEAAQAPIMVLALSRPEVNERRPGLGSGRRSTTIFLEPLPAPAMDRLIEGLVSDAPVPLQAELVKRAEGVPLYAVETVRALIDRDVVVPFEGRYVVDTAAAQAVDFGALGPPASLQALLAARLDGLPDVERRVVQDASVLGLSFSRAGLATLVPADFDLDAVLDSLRRKEILTVDADPRSPERGQLRFVQALLRGVAYDTLSRRDRHARHLAVAAYLSTLPEADAIAGVVAAHYLDAMSSLPDADGADELRQRAMVLLEQAALHATGVGAPASALDHYGRLIDLDPDDATLVRVAVAALPVGRRSGSYLDQLSEWGTRAEAAAERLGDDLARLTLRLVAADLTLIAESGADTSAIALEVLDACLGRPERISLVAPAAKTVCLNAQRRGDAALAQDATMRALADVERFGDDADFATLVEAMSMWSGLSGFRRLTALIRRAAVEHYDELDPDAVNSMSNLAAVTLNDDPVDARRAALESKRRGERLGVLTVPAEANLVTSAWSCGDFVEARAVLAARRAAGPTAAIDWEAYFAAGSGLVALATGDADLLMPGVTAAESSPDPVVAAWHLMHQAAAHSLAGEVDTACSVAVAALSRMRDLSESHEDLPLAFALAVDLTSAAGAIDQLAPLVEQLEAVSMGQRYRLLHGMLLRARALLSEAPLDGLREAIDVFAQMGAAYPAAQVRVELAAALAAAGDEAAAAAELAAVEPVLVEMGAEPLLARVRRLRAATVLSVG